MKFFLLILSVSFYSIACSQDANELLQLGNRLYREQKYDAAAAEYQKALSQRQDNTTKFNLANTTYRQGKEQEAKKIFREISATEKEPVLKSKAYYNEGAILSKEKRLEESIEAYKNALRKNPTDKEARENLQKALLELKKKDPPKQKQDQQKKQQQQQQRPQPKMSQKQAEQRLKLLEQKEKEVQQRLQKEKSKSGGGQGKDW